MVDGEQKPGKDTSPVFQAVIALTLPPKGQKLVGTCMRIDINNQVTVFDSTIQKAVTIWRTDIGHLYAVANVLVQSNSSEELQELIHNRVDEVFENWKIAFPSVPVSMQVIEPVIAPIFEQQPALEALATIIDKVNRVAEKKIVEINIESKLSSSQAEVTNGNK